jgi:hypothetical protein
MQEAPLARVAEQAFPLFSPLWSWIWAVPPSCLQFSPLAAYLLLRAPRPSFPPFSFHFPSISLPAFPFYCHLSFCLLDFSTPNFLVNRSIFANQFAELVQKCLDIQK